MEILNICHDLRFVQRGREVCWRQKCGRYLETAGVFVHIDPKVATLLRLVELNPKMASIGSNCGICEEVQV